MSEPEEMAGNMQEFSLVCQHDIVFGDPGDDVVLSCCLQPAISAASMEIKWKYRADLICHYKDGQITVSEGYEDTVSLSLMDLQNGDVSLKLRDITSSQRGIYTCEVICEWQAKKECIFLHLSSENFRLVAPHTISADPGEDVTLSFKLEPETNAVSMKIKWFKSRDLVYECKYGQETANTAYTNRVGLSSQELERGNLSLTLRNVQPSDSGSYTCKVFYDGNLMTTEVYLSVRDQMKSDCEKITRRLMKRALDFALRRTGSLENIPPNMEEKSSRSIPSPGIDNLKEAETEPQSSTSKSDMEASDLCREDLQKSDYDFTSIMFMDYNGTETIALDVNQLCNDSFLQFTGPMFDINHLMDSAIQLNQPVSGLNNSMESTIQFNQPLYEINHSMEDECLSEKKLKRTVVEGESSFSIPSHHLFDLSEQDTSEGFTNRDRTTRQHRNS